MCHDEPRSVNINRLTSLPLLPSGHSSGPLGGRMVPRLFDSKLTDSLPDISATSVDQLAATPEPLGGHPILPATTTTAASADLSLSQGMTMETLYEKAEQSVKNKPALKMYHMALRNREGEPSIG